MTTAKMLCAAMLLAASAQAQSSGTLTFGTGVLQSAVTMSGEATTTGQNLQSSIGYFATSQLVVGFSMENNISNDRVPFSLSVYTRYYPSKKEHQTVKFFTEVGAGFAHRNTSNALPGEVITNPDDNEITPSAHISTGLNIFMGKAVALELAPNYRYVTGVTPIHRIGAVAGIKFFISEKSFKKTFPHTFNKQY